MISIATGTERNVKAVVCSLDKTELHTRKDHMIGIKYGQSKGGKLTNTIWRVTHE